MCIMTARIPPPIDYIRHLFLLIGFRGHYTDLPTSRVGVASALVARNPTKSDLVINPASAPAHELRIQEQVNRSNPCLHSDRAHTVSRELCLRQSTRRRPNVLLQFVNPDTHDNARGPPVLASNRLPETNRPRYGASRPRKPTA